MVLVMECIPLPVVKYNWLNSELSGKPRFKKPFNQLSRWMWFDRKVTQKVLFYYKFKAEIEESC